MNEMSMDISRGISKDRTMDMGICSYTRPVPVLGPSEATHLCGPQKKSVLTQGPGSGSSMYFMLGVNATLRTAQFTKKHVSKNGLGWKRVSVVAMGGVGPMECRTVCGSMRVDTWCQKLKTQTMRGLAFPERKGIVDC